LDMAVRLFQNSTMRMRYSAIPVVVAPHGLTLGGGCEMCLHADAVVAAAESYIGLVELGVGLIPGGGGTKEMTVRGSDAFVDGQINQNYLQEKYLTIAQAKVSTSGKEAFEIGILREGFDQLVLNPDHVIEVAKQKALSLAQAGYTQPVPRKDIKVLGRSALGAMLAGINGMRTAQYISEYDGKLATKLAYVMCGGDLSEPTLVSEQYLLDLEREAFLSVSAERKTLERLQHMLKTGKPLRN
jgi:3-hydroxyacyl-CoA dehydrogenase